MSAAVRPVPRICVMADATSLRSAVGVISMDEGPLDTMATMSPSCRSVSTICCTMRRTWGVYCTSKCRSSTNTISTRPDPVSGARFGGGSTMPSSAEATGAGASRLNTRPPFTMVNDVMVCGWPSSSTVKSSFVRSATKLPAFVRTITSVVTAVTLLRNVGWPDAGGAWGACVCATITALPIRTIARAARSRMSGL